MVDGLSIGYGQVFIKFHEPHLVITCVPLPKFWARIIVTVSAEHFWVVVGMPLLALNSVYAHKGPTNHSLSRLPSRWYCRLVLATYCVAFALVVLGGVVRITGSGLGCPDWPLCHGRIIPPFDFHALVEYSHRLVAAVVSVLVLATSLLAWRGGGRDRGILLTANLMLGVLVTLVLLGAMTVVNELTPVIVTAHLAAAEALVGMLALLYVLVRCHCLRAPASALQRRPGIGLLWLTGTTVLVVACVILSGAYVRSAGTTFACSSWPNCVFWILPSNGLPEINVVHHLLALAGAGLVIASLAGVWHVRRSVLGGAVLAIAIAAVFGLQVVVGTTVIYSTWAQSARVVHLALATAVWTGVVALAGLTWHGYLAGLHPK